MFLTRGISSALAHFLIRAWTHKQSVGCRREWPPNVRYWGYSRHSWILACDGLSANDPTATLAVHCGNGFDAGFSPLSKYSFDSIQCCLLSLGAHATARVHHPSWRRSGSVATRCYCAKPKLHNWASGKSCSQATRAGKSSCREAVEKERKERGVQKTSSDRKDCASRTKILHILMRKEIV